MAQAEGGEEGDKIIGIDLGTTFTCAAVKEAGRKETDIILNNSTDAQMRSAVSFGGDQVLVGKAAFLRAMSHPNQVIFDSKRAIGRRFNDVKLQRYREVWPFKVGEKDGHPVYEIRLRDGSLLDPSPTPVDVAAHILRKIKKNAQQQLSCAVRRVVISVPAYFDQSQKNATMRAAEQADLEVVQLIPEPSAAAYGYGYATRRFDGYKLLVYDFGGGTFDVCIIDVKDGRFMVRAIGGDTALGGRDLDIALLDHCAPRIKEEFDCDCLNPSKRRAATLDQCEKLKESFSDTDQDVIKDGENGRDLYIGEIFPGLEELDGQELRITKDEYENAIRPSIQRTIDITRRTIADAGLEPEEISDLLAIGGSCYVPLVEEMLGEAFPHMNIRQDINKNEAVSRGCAVFAAMLTAQQRAEMPNIILENAVPISIGICCSEDRFYKLIERNTNYPTTERAYFETTINNQASFTIKIYEGERRIISENNYLGECHLVDLPARSRAGDLRCEVVFELNRNGLLHVVVQGQDKDGQPLGLRNTFDVDYRQVRTPRNSIEQMLESARINDDRDRVEFDRRSQRSELVAKIQMLRYDLDQIANLNAQQQELITRCDEVEVWLADNEGASREEFEGKLALLR